MSPAQVGSAPLNSESTALELTVEAAGSQHTLALLALFERTGTACACQYWHFTGDKNDWLNRLFHEPAENRSAFSADLERGGQRGVVASCAGLAVGWLKLTPASSVQKLYSQRLYKGLPCFGGPRDGVLTIGCLLVDESLRRRGVARALVKGAVGIAERMGARAIEAFPRRSEQAGPAELWTGPPNIFLEAGFRVVSDFAPYPVLRYDVSRL